MSSAENESKLDGLNADPDPQVMLLRLALSQLATDNPSSPELFFGIVRTLGSDTNAVTDLLSASLINSGYEPHLIKISSQFPNKYTGSSAIVRYQRLMDEGDNLRQALGGGEAAALLALKYLQNRRNELNLVRTTEGSLRKLPRAWIFESLMHPKEVALLKQVFGKRFFVIACDAPYERRFRAVEKAFSGRSGLDEATTATEALKFIYRDAGNIPEDSSSVPKKFRLAVAKTMHLADVFTNTDDSPSCQKVIQRFVECIFGHMYHTPTHDEMGMAMAFTSALGTATLSRRVGACIVKDEQICSVGCNEVPKYGGGIYHAESNPNHREHIRTGDPNDRIRAELLSDLLLRFKRAGNWLSPEKENTEVEQLLDEAVKNSSIRDSELFDVIEYTRAAHAEAVAITMAAARGIPIRWATLYTTTLPCHECTRLIVAAGIKRVVYIEPYPKSRGAELQEDAVAMAAQGREHPDKVAFVPFVGMASHRLEDLFSWVDRKSDDVRAKEGISPELKGEAVVWSAASSKLRSSIFDDDFPMAEIFGQAYKEQLMIDRLNKQEARAKRG